jgi:hypothetical protein
MTRTPRTMSSATVMIAAALVLAACAKATTASGTQADAGPAQASAGAQRPPGTAPAQPDQTPAGSQPRVNEDARLGAEFLKRVEEYVKLHRKIEEQLPKLPKEATPEQIDRYQRELARLIQQGRPNARQGDVFTKEIRAYFRRQLHNVFSGAEGRQLKQTIMDENPGPLKLSVNGRYPDSVPLSTMPPQVLAALPKLPDELEYRFIGDRLIVLDVHAHIIVDYTEDALPK